MLFRSARQDKEEVGDYTKIDELRIAVRQLVEKITDEVLNPKVVKKAREQGLLPTSVVSKVTEIVRDTPQTIFTNPGEAPFSIEEGLIDYKRLTNEEELTKARVLLREQRARGRQLYKDKWEDSEFKKQLDKISTLVSEREKEIIAEVEF